MYAKMTLHWYQNELCSHLFMLQILSKHFHCECADQGDSGKKVLGMLLAI